MSTPEHNRDASDVGEPQPELSNNNRLAVALRLLAKGIAKQVAADYTHRGLKLCQIPSGQKGPITPGWNLRENAITDVDYLTYGDEFNIGLLTGYSGVLALDLDNIDKARPAFADRGIDLDALIKTPGMVRRESGKPNNTMLLFNCPEPRLTKRYAEKHGFEIISINATGTSPQVILPPSIHPQTKQPYRWAAGNWRHLPEIPPDLAAFFDAHGATVFTERPKSETPTPSRKEPRWDTIQRLLTLADPNCGRDTWLHVLMSVHHETQGSEEGFQAMLKWSMGRDGKCPKFESEQDVRDRWKSFRLDRDNPTTLESQLRKYEPPAATEEFEDLGPTRKRLLQNIGEFLKEKTDPEHWLVEGLLPAGGTSILVAKPKVGKSTLSRVLAVAVALGVPFMGKNALKGTVFYLTLEESRAGLLGPVRKGANIAGLPEPVGLPS
jgi:hypothetical protein